MAGGSGTGTQVTPVPRDINSRTVLEVITAAYRRNGVYEVGESLSAAEASDGLLAMQDMIAEWAAEGITVPVIVEDSVVLTIGQVEYTIGQSGSPDIETLRPEQITRAFIRSDTFDYVVSIIGEAAYARLRDKSGIGSVRPRYLWYNPTVPNGTIFLYREVTATDTLFISSLKPFVDNTSLTDDMTVELGIPRAYQAPITNNLAIELGMENGIDPSPALVARAMEGKKNIKSLAIAQSVQGAVIEFARQGWNSNRDLIPFG